MNVGRQVTLSRNKHGKIGMWFERPNNARWGPFVIVKIEPNTPVDECPFLKPGDVFFAVNGQDIRLLDAPTVAALMRGRAHSSITLGLFAGWPNLPSSMPPTLTNQCKKPLPQPTPLQSSAGIDLREKATTQTQPPASGNPSLEWVKKPLPHASTDPSKKAPTQTQQPTSKHCQGCGIPIQDGFPEAHQLGDKCKYLLPLLDTEMQMQTDVILQQFELIMRQRVHVCDTEQIVKDMKKHEEVMANTILGLRDNVKKYKGMLASTNKKLRNEISARQQWKKRAQKLFMELGFSGHTMGRIHNREARRTKMRYILQHGSLSPQEQKMRLGVKADKYGKWKKTMQDKHGIFLKKSFAAFLQSAV